MFPKKEVQLTVVGKVFRANRKKVLALNETLEEYFKLVNCILPSIQHQRLFCTKMATRKLNNNSTSTLL